MKKKASAKPKAKAAPKVEEAPLPSWATQPDRRDRAVNFVEHNPDPSWVAPVFPNLIFNSHVSEGCGYEGATVTAWDNGQVDIETDSFDSPVRFSISSAKILLKMLEGAIAAAEKATNGKTEG